MNLAKPKMNYSKWDKLEVSDSDDGSDQEADAKRPTVRVLEEGSRVTIGPSGASVSKACTSKENNAVVIPQSNENNATFSTANSNLKDSSICANYITNGHIEADYHWSQDRTEVLLYYNIPADLKAKGLKIEAIRSPSIALGGPVLSVRLSEPGTGVLFSKPLLFDVHLNDDKENAVDWELVNHGNQRHILFTLRKRPPMDGTTVWWTTVFRGEGRPVDLASIKGRSQQQPQQQVWDEAHRQFKERVGMRVKQDVELVDNND